MEITMGFEKINDNLYLFIDENFYEAIVGAIVLPTKLVMVDSGIHVTKMKEFKEWVEKETGKKFEYLILTHYHSDHLMGNQFFTDCQIIADQHIHDYMKGMKERWTPEKIEELIEQQEDKTQYQGLEITPPNTVLNETMEINDDDITVLVKRTGGHTKDSTYVYCPKYSVLFAGDNLFEENDIYGGDETCNPEVWLEVFKHYLTLDADIIIPGHGKAADKTLIEASISYLTKVKQTMKKMHEDGKTKEEILEAVYPMNFAPYNESNEHDVMLHKSTHKRWYEVWIEGKK
jgi:glyoxylase-like metal-dependent hydrolase (beta-lactamase superfamily II)